MLHKQLTKNVFLNDRNILRNGKRMGKRWQLTDNSQSVDYGQFTSLKEAYNAANLIEELTQNYLAKCV